MNQLILPKIWSNPQNIRQYIAAAKENILNIIPPSTLENAFTSFPNFVGDTHYIVDPEILCIILRDRVEDFPKSRIIDITLGTTIPKSIFVIHGDKWKEQHRLAVKVFNWRNVQNFEAPIRHISENYLNGSDLSTSANQDITPLMQELTSQVIAKILVGDHKSTGFSMMRESFERNVERIVRINIFDIPALRIPYFPNLRHFRDRKFIREFQHTATSIIEERVNAAQPKYPDFLEMMIEAYDYRHRPSKMALREIRDNIATFLIAGHETTAMTLSWALYAISHFPKAQEKIRNEARKAKTLDQLILIEAFINETLRLFPPAPTLIRRATKPETIGALKMKAAEGIVIPIITLHRHRKYWDQPDEFLPERFVDFKPKPYRFMPFGAGPRICIGASLAIMESKIIFAEILKRYRITPSQHIPHPRHFMTMRSQNGIQVNFEKL